jgi:hypothetical protein
MTSGAIGGSEEAAIVIAVKLAAMGYGFFDFEVIHLLFQRYSVHFEL